MAGTTDITLHWVQTLDDANRFMSWLGERRAWLALDTETEGFDWWKDALRTVQFGDRNTGWCLEWNRWGGLVIEALATYEGPIVMHNAKFDTHFLEVNGAPVKRWLVHDSRAMAHIVNPAIQSGLKARAARELGGWAMHGQAQLKEAMLKGGWDFGTIPVDLLWQYAAFDTCLTAQLAEELWPRVEASYLGIYQLELASTQVLCDMERRGILTDPGYLAWGLEQFGRDLAAVQHRIKEEFLVANPNSDAQVIAVLQASGWVPLAYTDKGRVKLDQEVLAAIDHPLAPLTVEYRDLRQTVNTYLGNVSELAGPDGRLHASINPLGARTGRMSVSRPSLQNLPANDARVRNAFVAEQGNSLIRADYDQIEMRIFAHYSGSRAMIDAVRYGDWMTSQGHDGYDFHSMSARMVFGIGADEPVPKPARKRVKTVGFGKVYGAAVPQLASIMGCSMAEAQVTMDQYEYAFPETRKDGFQSRIAEALVRRDRESKDPHVLTAYGRKEPCWPSEAYKAVNYLIQGTAADVLKDRLVALSRTWLGEHMILPIHDEIIFEVPDGAVHDAVAEIRRTMPEPDKFQVPLTVDTDVVKRWGDAYAQHERGGTAAEWEAFLRT